MNSFEQQDVIVIGGGPAGLSAAKAAASKGLSVLLLEKSLEIGYPVHTSGGSWTKELTELGIPNKYIHPIFHLDVLSDNAKFTIDYTKSEICIIDIRGVYQHLAEEASLAGGVILTNTIAREPIYENGKLCGVKAVRNGKLVEYKAKMLIDASGFSSAIVRKMGIEKKNVSYGNGAEYEIITNSWQQDKTAIMLGSTFSPVGYAWVFPYGENRVRVGIGVVAPKSMANPLELLENYMNTNHEITRQLKPYSILEVHLGAVPNSGYIEKSYADNLMIVGDAAGQVLGIAGEGIRLALDIGRMAGETAANAIKEQDTSERFLKQYETLWKKKYGLSINLNHAMNEIITNYSDAKWDKVISIMKDVDPDIILALMKGNFDMKLVSMILTRNPGLFAYNAIKMLRKTISGK